ncbi:hypothetical protein Tco_0080457 [Tanacetum coccineum]
MTRSSTESKTSLAIAANLSELELEKILIDKMESNKSIHRLMNKRISTKYWLTLKKVTSSYLTLMVILSRLKDAEMMRIKTKNHLLDQRGSKSQHKMVGESAQAEDPMHTTNDLEEPTHQEFEIGVDEDPGDYKHILKVEKDNESLERYVGGDRQGFYTSAGNPVKEILLKFNLPDHRSILTDSKVTPTEHGRMTKPYLSPRLTANCFNAGYLKMEVKVPDSS